MTKGDQTRVAILETARTLFSEKGYAAVSMGDICERHGLSRGGLYRHFGSTREIFTAMLEADKETTAAALDEAIAAGIPAKQLFDYFIHQQKQSILNGGGRLSIAVYEFCSTHPDQQRYLDERFSAAVAILDKLIRYGQARGEYKPVDAIGDAKSTASHIVIFLEGLKLSSAVTSFSPTMLEDQLRYLYQMIVLE